MSCRAVSGTALRDGAFAGDGMPALSASPGADGDIRGHRFCFPQGNSERMNRLKPHLALLTCNVVWALDYPFYNIVLPYYVHPMAMISASLIATALLSLIPLLWERAERVERADIRRLIGAALLIGVLRKVFLM